MEWFEQVREILNTPLIIGGGLSLTLGGIAVWIISAIVKTKSKNMAFLNTKVSSVQKDSKNFVKKSEHNSIIVALEKQNSLNKKIIENIKNENVRNELENERIECEKLIPTELTIETDAEPQKVEKPNKKKRF